MKNLGKFDDNFLLQEIPFYLDTTIHRYNDTPKKQKYKE